MCLPGVGRIFHTVLITILLVTSLLPTAVCQEAPARRTGVGGRAGVTQLDLDSPVARDLKGDQTHTYSIDLSAGQVVNVSVDQVGIDVVVRLCSPDGNQLNQVDSPSGDHGFELALLAARAAGSYLIEVRSFEEKAEGRYEIAVEELRPGTPEGARRIAALEDLRQARELDLKNTLNSLRQALVKYADSLSLLETAHDLRGTREVLFSMGEVYRRLARGEGHQKLEENQKAIEYYDRTATIMHDMKAWADEAFVLEKVAVIYKTLEDWYKSLEYFGQALQRKQSVGDQRGAATTLNNMGFVYATASDGQKALEYYGRSLALKRSLGDRLEEARSLNNMAAVYDALREKQKAIEYYDAALVLFRAEGDKRLEAMTINNLAMLYHSIGDQQKAIEHLELALPLRRAARDPTEEANTLHNMGVVYWSLGKKQMALSSYDMALTLLRAARNSQGEAKTLNYIGIVYSATDEIPKAMDTYDQALRLSRASGDHVTQVRTLYLMARAEYARNRLVQARENMRAALDIIESVRTRLPDPQARASYFASMQDYYGFYIRVLMGLNHLYPGEGFDALALQASEQAHARMLLELLSEGHAEIRKGVDETLLQRESSLFRSLNSRAEALARPITGGTTRQAIRQEVEQLLVEYQEVRSQIKAKSPVYGALMRPRSLGLKEIQQQILDPDTLLLEYALGEDQSYLWLVTHDSIMSYELPKRDELEKLIFQAYELLTARSHKPFDTPEKRNERVAKADAEYPRIATGLSNVLLGPVAGLLGKKRLFIVGQGALEYLPFSALPSPSTRNSLSGEHPPGPSASIRRASALSHSKEVFRPLVLDHEIVNLPSASSLAVLRRETFGRRKAAKSIAIFADPVFSSRDPRLNARSPAVSDYHGTDETVALTTSRKPDVCDVRYESGELARSARDLGLDLTEGGFERLPYSGVEAKSILPLAPPPKRKAALDFEATKSNALSPDITNYRYVHFATHAFLNNRYPELSGIVLSLVDRHGVTQDGFLRMYEIYGLRLPVELVVLSACRTGLGKEIKGEGLVGLTRGFLSAGAARVIVSLWDVDDRGTANLMPRLYKGMLGKRGLTPTKALRAAQISMWRVKRWHAPYYWAAFVLQGEPN